MLEIRSALASFKSYTSIGLDGWEFQTAALLSDEALTDWAVIRNRCKKELAFPWVALISSLALIPKKRTKEDIATGKVRSRTVAAMSSFMRLDARLDRPILEEWDRSTAHPQDSARPGSSSEQAAEFLSLIHI